MSNYTYLLWMGMGTTFGMPFSNALRGLSVKRSWFATPGGEAGFNTRYVRIAEVQPLGAEIEVSK